MAVYNKIMKFFWLLMAIVTFLFITYKCITDDYKTWIFYYTFTLIALLMYGMKVWMERRMAKHLRYLEEQKNAKS